MHPSSLEKRTISGGFWTLCCASLNAQLRIAGVTVQHSHFTKVDTEAQSGQRACSRSQSKSIVEQQGLTGQELRLRPASVKLGEVPREHRSGPLQREAGKPVGAWLTHAPPPPPGSGAGPSSNLQGSNMAPRLCSISAAARRLLGGPGPRAGDVAAAAAAR